MSPANRKTKVAAKKPTVSAKRRAKPTGKPAKSAKPTKSTKPKRTAKPPKAHRPKPPPPATTIGVNPLDAPVSTAAVIAAILGPAAGRRAERRTAKARR